MEMNDQKQRDWNPTVYAFDSGTNGVGRSGFSRAGTLTSIIHPENDQGTILGFGSGSVTMNIAGQSVVVPSLMAFIQAIQTNLESNILSTPKIMALDNEESTIEVGDEIPVSTNSTLAANGVAQQSTTREKATVKLVMTPFIRPDSDAVRLKITELSVRQPTTVQAVSATLAATNVSIAERTIKTNIVVNNGDTAVLGGLIRDEEDVDETKVPILGDIPVLGWLFKSSRVNKRKINLTVFLTPKIIRTNNPATGHDLLNAQVNERVDWIKKNFSGRDPYGKKVDSLPRGMASTELQETDEPIHSKNNGRHPVSHNGTPKTKQAPKKMKQ